MTRTALDTLEGKEKPLRAYEIILRASGDTWEDARRMVEEYAEMIRTRPPEAVDCVTVGYSVGGYVKAITHPEITHDLWAKRLQAYLDEPRPEDTP